MTIVSFPGYTPPPRYDEQPWTAARLEQSATEGGAYTTTETFELDPVDTDPAAPDTRSFTTEQGAADLWYRIVWVDADGDESPSTAPGQNTTGTVPGTVTAYVTAAELASILQVNATTNAVALERVLVAAAGKINSEIGRSDLSGWELELAAQVNLAVAEELWKQMKAPWGVLGIDSEFGATRIARDTFERHAHALAPLKRSWGIA
jgi:hypothetical protein